jgi:hypothetical protein
MPVKPNLASVIGSGCSKSTGSSGGGAVDIRTPKRIAQVLYCSAIARGINQTSA